MRCHNLLRASAVGVSLFIISSTQVAVSATPHKSKRPAKAKPGDNSATNDQATENDEPDRAASRPAQANVTTGAGSDKTNVPPAENTADNGDPTPSATVFSASLSQQTSKQLALGLLAPHPLAWHTITVRRGDTLSQMFSRLNLKANDWMPVLNLGDTVAPLKTMRPGDTLEIRKTPAGRLAELRYPLDAVNTLAVTRENGQLHAEMEQRPLRTRQVRAAGVVDGSLWKALSKAGVPARVATRLSRIYSYRLNLSRHVHAGDRFSVIYKAGYSDGKRVDVGPVVAASFDTRDKSYKAFRAVDDNGTARYYDPSGHSYKPSISRHPVNYTRISSPFSYSRMNPVLHIRRPHTGVDLAAARGTPVHAAADGTVKFVGRNGGYGRLVELKHFDHYSTRYGHLSRYAKGLHDGEHVTQGQVIGYVSATGVATGPHLHFEVRKNGRPHNPMTMKLPNGTPLPMDRLASFTQRIQPLIAKLDTATQPEKTQVAQNASDYWMVALGHCGQTGQLKLYASTYPAPQVQPLNNRFLGNDLFCLVASNNGA